MWREHSQIESDKEHTIIKQLEKAEQETRLLESLRATCKWIEWREGIPPPYPLCRHPESKTGVCSHLDDCPRREEVQKK